MTAHHASLFASLLGTGMIAGLLFGWTVSVIPGTMTVDDRTYLVTMQNINRRIINPAFVLSFVATPAVLAAATLIHLRDGQTWRSAALGTAAISYMIGVVAVTARRNIPLNTSLDTFDLLPATPAQMRIRRESYERPWNRWHYVRTFASVVSFSLTAVAGILSDVAS